MEINEFEATSLAIRCAKAISDEIIGQIVEVLTLATKPLTLKEITNYINGKLQWCNYSEQAIRKYLHNMVIAKLIKCEERKEETIKMKTNEAIEVDQDGEPSKVEVTDSMGRKFIVYNPYFHHMQKPRCTVFLEKSIQVRRYYYSLAKKGCLMHP